MKACGSVTSALLVVLSLAPACSAPPPRSSPAGEPVPRHFDEIEVCGLRFHTGTKVVLWNDPGGFDGYRCGGSRAGERGAGGAHYSLRRAGVDERLAARVERRGWTLDELRDVVDQFVVHYDVAGTSRRCFEVLQERGLSVHFLLDVDGTLYQTLDLKEKAWHATRANSRSIGVEIAHIGAYPPARPGPLPLWYEKDSGGTRLVLPEALARSSGFGGRAFRPARPEPIRSRINGGELVQYDFTAAQYEALAHLLATLHRVFPRIVLEAPRDAEGRILDRALTAEEFARFSGVLGHWHVQREKVDPGPAFDWERVLAHARRLSLVGAGVDATVRGGASPGGGR